MSWLPGFLSAFFDSNTRYWAAVKKMMETQIGEIVVHHPIEGGPVQAFFKQQTLTGSRDKTTFRKTSDNSLSLDMSEHMGLGINTQEAIITLWEKMTNLDPEDDILVFQHSIQGVDPHALYLSLDFKNGEFQKGGMVYAECPPDRLAVIQKAMNESLFAASQARLSQSAEDKAFGEMPKGGRTRLWATSRRP